MLTAISRMRDRNPSLRPIRGALSTRRGRRVVGTALIAASLLVSSCASTRTFTVESPLTTPPATEPLSVRVGIRYSPELPSFALVGRGGYDVNYLVGPASIAAFDVAFAGLFREHRRLSDSNVAGEERSAVATIEVRPDYGGCSASYCLVVYLLDFHSQTGELITTWHVEGLGIRPGYAVRDAVATVVTKLVEWSRPQLPDKPQPEELAVRRWFAGMGINRDGARIANTASGQSVSGLVEVQARTGMVVLPTTSEKEPLAKCVQDALVWTGGAPHFVAGQAWRDALFPWFEVRRAPDNAEDMARILATPVARERAAALGARYLVWIEGQTKEGDMHGPLVPGFAGVGWWNKRSEARAVVWDLAKLASLGPLEVKVSGTAIMAEWALILILPLVPATETESCEQLAKKILALTATGGPGPASMPPAQ